MKSDDNSLNPQWKVVESQGLLYGEEKDFSYSFVMFFNN